MSISSSNFYKIRKNHEHLEIILKHLKFQLYIYQIKHFQIIFQLQLSINPILHICYIMVLLENNDIFSLTRIVDICQHNK